MKTNHNEKTSQKQSKSPYDKPEVIKHGKVNELTLGAGSGTLDDGTFGSPTRPTKPR